MKALMVSAIACCLAFYPSIGMAIPWVVGVELWDGLRSGATVAAVRIQEPNSRPKHFSGFTSTVLNEAPTNPNDDDSLEDTAAIGSRSVHADFLFKRGLLKDVVLNIDDISKSDSGNIAIFDELEHTLEAQYGTPSKCDRYSILDKLHYINYVCQWLIGPRRINVLLMDTTGVPIITVSYHADGAEFNRAP